MSRYEFERLRHDSLTEDLLEQELTARGSNYAAIKHHHNIHKSLECSVVEALERAGLQISPFHRSGLRGHSFSLAVGLKCKCKADWDKASCLLREVQLSAWVMIK